MTGERMTIYHAWAKGWKWVVIFNHLCRLMMNQHGWFAMTQDGRWQQVRPDIMCDPVPRKRVQYARGLYK